jgi:general secretion pathway protein K
MQKPLLKRASGVALLTVLFILVLITTLSVYLVEEEHLAIRRISNQRDAEQGFQMTAGAEQWALKILERDGKENSVDHLQEPWNVLLPEVKVEEGTLLSEVHDLQGLFNINNLAAGRDEVWYPLFTRLLSVLEINEAIADALIDWIDGDQDVTGSNGAEDADYLGLDIPHRTADRMIADIGELIWVKGFDVNILTTLSPYITALPVKNTKININTCHPLLLKVLTKDILPDAAAESLIEGRGEEGYQEIETFLTRTELAAESDNVEPLITINSKYFQVRSEAKFGRLTTVLLSTVQRKTNGDKVTVLRRRRGLS